METLDTSNESLFSVLTSELDEISDIINNSLGNSDFDYILACDAAAELRVMFSRLEGENNISTEDSQTLKLRITELVDQIWEKFPDALIVLTEDELHAEMLENLREAEGIYREDAAVAVSEIGMASVDAIMLRISNIHGLFKKIAESQESQISAEELARIQARVDALLDKLPKKSLKALIAVDTRAAVGSVGKDGVMDDEVSIARLPTGKGDAGLDLGGGGGYGLRDKGFN